MADDYWIETVGGITRVGKRGQRHHRSGYDFGDSAPYMYTVVVREDGTLAKVYDDDTSEVGGPLTTDATINAGWSTKARNLTSEFNTKWGSSSAAEKQILQSLANRASAVLQSVKGRSPSRTDEMNWNTAQNLATFYIKNRRGPDNGVPSAPKGGPETTALINASTDVVPDSSSVFGDIIHTLNKAADSAGKALSSIPVIGGVIHAALGLNPIAALGGLAAGVLRGERLDHAFLNAAKHEVNAVKEAAPYVSKVMSFVPGVGTGIAAAIAAGTALAEGRTISDAILDSVVAAVPGGALGRSAAKATIAIASGGNVANAALDAAVSNLPREAQTVAGLARRIASGENVSKAAIDTATAQLPASIRAGVDTALAAAKGGNVKTAVLHAIRATVPAEVQKAVDVATAVAAARNVQSATVSALQQPANIAKLAAVGAKATLMPKPPTMPAPIKRAKPLVVAKVQPKKLPPVPTMPAPVAHAKASATPQVSLAVAKNGLSPEAQQGFNIAIGALAHTAVPASALVGLRSTLTAEQQAGFDHAAKTVNNLERPEWSSLVTRGKVLRGDWRVASTSTANAVMGHVVKDGAVKRGLFVRV
jgi:hypothetical protein